ncbi:hypothetical protein [Pseudomonas sp. HTZ1]|uniref:hypothetical protein n=1 Tax=Pseudomonas sp. HTZ1 TaxID=3075219 RepID=UPI00287C8044|nr:hypothetical protein [Pseudomonas sp. HTZ1]MDS9590700.1 hypothetical protein [Pseudomonas sp. HTZ1]
MDYMAAQMDRQIEGAEHRYDEALKEGEQPAFPVAASEYGGHGTCFGLTIRDYFAAKALAGFAANPSMIDSNDSRACSWVADCSYAMADAMLAVRVKQ